MTELPESIYVRTDDALLVDGEPFPWLIHPDGPTVHVGGTDELMPALWIPVVAERIVVEARPKESSGEAESDA